MGRELGQLAELCVPDADLTPGKRREGKKDGSKSLKQTCSSKKMSEV